MWPFARKQKFKVGDIVILVDQPEWVVNRHLIGVETSILALPQAKQWKYNNVMVPPGYYLVDIPSCVGGVFGTAENTMRHKKPGDDKFQEPRDLGDDEPNKVVRWDSIQYFKPQKEKTHEES